MGFSVDRDASWGFLVWFGLWLCCVVGVFFSKAVAVLKMLRTWRGSAAEVFEASQLVFPSAPSRPGRHGQPEACPTDGNQLSHRLGLLLSWSPQVSQQRCRRKGELCVLQPSPELASRAINLQYRGVVSHENSSSGYGALLMEKTSASLASPCNGGAPSLPSLFAPLYFQGLPCPKKTLSWLK